MQAEPMLEGEEVPFVPNLFGKKKDKQFSVSKHV